MNHRNQREPNRHSRSSETELRRQAEARRKKRERSQAEKDLRTQSLVFELEVHQEELNIQNEELRRSQQETAELLRKYTDLYEFAPVGYFTVDENNTVVQANRHAAEMLNGTKGKLIDRHFGSFLLSKDLAIFQALVDRALKSGANEACELHLITPRGSVDVQMHARRVDEIEPPLVQIAAFDITARKQAEQALQATNRRLEERVRERTAELQKSKRELQYIAENTIHLLERERRKISLDLHDTIAQGLATIKLLLENKLATMDRETAPSPFSIERILDIAGRSLNETRRIMYYLRPKMLDEIGFLATLRWHWQEFDRLHPEISVRKDIRIAENKLPEELTLVVYRIVQEATQNIERHSRADRVEFSLQQQKDRLQLRIADNGGGFDPENPEAEPGTKMGINSMKERAELSGGQFTLQSADGEGTVVDVRWDLGYWNPNKCNK